MNKIKPKTNESKHNMRKKSTCYKYDLIGIGNAVVDIFNIMDNDELNKLNIAPGSMHLITKNKSDQLSQALPCDKMFAGGSFANTSIGVASFGGKVGFIGKIHDDVEGRLFHGNMKKHMVEFAGSITNTGADTGKSFIMVAPNGRERTMLTYLGAALELSANDINEHIIKNSKTLFVEGYFWDVEKLKQAALYALDIAVKHKVKIAFSLSDKLCVERHKLDFQNLIFNKVDVLFGNKTHKLLLL